MFAQIYPILRLPRRFGFFDYAVPEGVEAHAGDLVEIRFHGRLTLGIIKSVSTNTEVKKTIPLGKILTPLFIQLGDIERLEAISCATIQSPASIFHACFQGISAKSNFHWLVIDQKPTLRFEKDLTERIQKISEHIFYDVEKSHQASFVQTSLEGSVLLAHLLQRKTSGQFLILVPTEREADILHQQTVFPQSATLHGKTKPNIRKSILEAWRTGELKTLITTRQGALLPAKKIEIILVLDAGSGDYLVTDRNPRLDVRLCAELLARQHQARQVLYGPVPRTDELANQVPIDWDEPAPFELIDLLRKEESTGHALISESLQKATSEALQNGKKTLWFANRKGGAKRLQCTHCGYIPRCGTCHSFPVVRADDYFCSLCHTQMWVPQECPSCGSKRLKTSGIGIERIAKSAAHLFPEARIAICDKEHAPDPEANILLVTEAYFANIVRPFQDRSFGLVADVCLEHHFLASNDRSPESALRKVFRLAYFAKHQHARCLIQTVDALRAQTLQDPASFLQKELEIRKTYHLSPTSWTWRTGEDTHTADTPEEIPTVIAHLQTLPDSAIIQPDLPSYGPFCSQPPK